MDQAVEEAAESLVEELVKPYMSDQTRAKALHDHLVLNVRYDLENYKNDSLPNEAYTAYGALVEGVAVCEGYAAAFKILGEKAGLQVLSVTGRASTAEGLENHAWNMVLSEGKVHHVDTTWNDPDDVLPGQVLDTYFWVPASRMEQDHTWDKAQFGEEAFLLNGIVQDKNQ
nr:transglutaminase domain-containing protein [Anaerotalea alkaliphila]